MPSKIVLLKCSSCNKDLVNVAIVRPESEEEWKVKAFCCYCSNYSFVKDIKGGFSLAPVQGVQLVDVNVKGNLVEVYTGK